MDIHEYEKRVESVCKQLGKLRAERMPTVKRFFREFVKERNYQHIFDSEVNQD